MTIEYYKPKRVVIRHDPNGLYTAAVLSCGLCGNTIDGMGGPGDGAMCIHCTKLLRTGQLSGAVKWDEYPPKE